MTRPFDRVMLALVVALAAAGLLLILSQPRASRLTSDFTINYSAGLLVRQGHLADIYHQAELAAMMRRVAPDGAIDPRLPFSLPLATALPFALLSLAPLEIAFRVWQLIAAALLLVAVLLLQRARPLGRNGPGLAVLGLLAAVPTWTTMTEGQVTPFLFMGGAMMIATLTHDQPLLAVCAGAMLAVKPQYLPAYLVVLFAARRWRCLIVASAGALVILMSPLLGGIDGLAAMIRNALSANQLVAVGLDEAWIGVVGRALPAAAATAVGIGLFVVVLAALALSAWRRPNSVIGFAVLAGIVPVLASPHALPHDLLLLAVPAWLAVALYRDGALPDPIPALLIADIAMLIDLRGVGIPLAPIAITVVTAWYGRQFRLRAARKRLPPVARVA